MKAAAPGPLVAQWLWRSEAHHLTCGVPNQWTLATPRILCCCTTSLGNSHKRSGLASARFSHANSHTGTLVVHKSRAAARIAHEDDIASPSLPSEHLRLSTTHVVPVIDDKIRDFVASDIRAPNVGQSAIGSLPEVLAGLVHLPDVASDGEGHFCAGRLAERHRWQAE